MLSNKRLQPLTEKIEIRLLKWLTLKRSPDDVEMLIKHEGAVIEVVDFKAGARVLYNQLVSSVGR